MIAFFNDAKIKQKYLDRVKAHAHADEIIKGKYWENGKGCAVGCTIHSENHAAYETELGIPQWLARLEDRIFEGMPTERSMKWPAQFLETINLGADLEKIKIPMLIFIVESAREKTKNERSLKAIDGVLTELKKDPIDFEKLHEARSAAYAVYDDAYDAYAATYAADAAYAVYAAYAADAADAAYAAGDAATYAAYAAVYAATYAAGDAGFLAKEKEFVKLADKLLELIKECK